MSLAGVKSKQLRIAIYLIRDMATVTQKLNVIAVSMKSAQSEIGKMKSELGLDDFALLKDRARESHITFTPTLRAAEIASYQQETIEVGETTVGEMVQANHNHPGMSVDELCEKVKTEGRDGLIREYKMIHAKDQENKLSFKAAKSKGNYQKNRYGDVLAADHSRVILKDGATDYINANYVNGFDHQKAYISTQGPLEHTVGDFWSMIWQENTRVIVMTTKLAEKGKLKCDVYWPVEPAQEMTSGTKLIQNKGIAHKGLYQITLLEITEKKKKETRKLKHFLFLGWPDYGVPGSADGFLKFLFHIRKAQHDFTKELGSWKGHPRGPPLVVHCSAGVGRTGTFISIDISIYMYDATTKSDIHTTVLKIRKDRPLSVQMPEQYLFIHIALLRYTIKMGKLGMNCDNSHILELPSPTKKNKQTKSAD